MSLELNSILHGRYRVIDEIGRGGMSIVYRGYDENLRVEVVIKENSFASLETGRQFKREARLLASLRHPNLPRVTDNFEIPGQGQYLVMDFIRGDDARKHLERLQGPLSEDEVLVWMRQIMDALKYLHLRPDPIIHRDIKPANIIIPSQGEAKLVDFGLAKEFDPLKSTTAGAKAFTPGFAPPEQYGRGRTDVRTDIYSLGATIYNLITAVVPADSLQRLMGQERLVPISRLNPNVSRHVAMAVERAMELNPEDRFATIEDFDAALFPEPVSERDISKPDHRMDLQKTKRRDPVLAVETTVESTPTVKRSYARIFLILILGVVFIGFGIWGLPKITGMFNGATPTITPVLSATGVEGVIVIATQKTATEVHTLVPSNTPSPDNTPIPEISPTLHPSPSGGELGQIAFVSERSGRPQIFIIDVDGSNLTQLSNMTDGACQPAWSPDGTSLLFTSPCRKKARQYPNAGIYSMNADGSDNRPFIVLVGGVYDADWSEAGVAFTYLENNRPSIWKVSESGLGEQRISRSNSIDSQPSWSPAGDKFVFVNTSSIGSPTLFWVFEDGTYTGANPDQVTRNQLVSSPDWSPTGEFVAYLADNMHIFVVKWDAKGFNETKLTIKGPNADPDWSPDGQWLTFESWQDTGNHDIYIMRANGSQQTRLTEDPAWDYQPAWRP
jgi:serine/threonine protein kinase